MIFGSRTAARLRYLQIHKRLIPREVMLQLKIDVGGAYLWQDRQANAGVLDVSELAVARRWGGLNVPQFKSFYGGSPALNQIRGTIEDAYPGLRMVEEVSAFRRIKADKSTYIYWHLDADGTGSWQFDPLWNFWLPLETVGDNYPSLEVMTNSEEIMRKEPLMPGEYAHRSDEWVAEKFPKQDIICPRLRPGDTLIFSHYMLHRTQPMTQIAGDRIGCELRFTLQQAKRMFVKRWLRRSGLLRVLG
jgi:hypothetical protein